MRFALRVMLAVPSWRECGPPWQSQQVREQISQNQKENGVTGFHLCVGMAMALFYSFALERLHGDTKMTKAKSEMKAEEIENWLAIRKEAGLHIVVAIDGKFFNDFSRACARA
jgi:hypothetical protein